MPSNRDSNSLNLDFDIKYVPATTYLLLGLLILLLLLSFLCDVVIILKADSIGKLYLSAISSMEMIAVLFKARSSISVSNFTELLLAILSIIFASIDFK